METKLTSKEQEFYTCLKRKLIFSSIEIRTKIPLADLCSERNDIVFHFGKDREIISDVIIDFVLYKNGKVISCVEIFDEPDELENRRGENLLKDLLLSRMGYEYFKVIDLDNIGKAAAIVKEKTLAALRNKAKQ
ncbi:MAG: hypothetical protein IKO38_11025 [Erysipelotrichaceae bacterium]|nr:hypothetical protein [Erysipelotrichaceae bacterium]